MDNLNLKNTILAYQAVYDNVLCESMDELGFFDEALDPNQVQNKSKGSKYGGRVPKNYMKTRPSTLQQMSGSVRRGAVFRPTTKTQESYDLNELGFFDEALDPNQVQNKSKGSKYGGRVPKNYMKTRPSTLQQMSGSVRRGAVFRPTTKTQESYDLNELILLHLLDEGYADSVEGALAILENMSDEWLEEIVEERAPGVKPYRANPTQAEVRRNEREARKSHLERDKGKSGYGPTEKFYKPEDSRIPDNETAEWLRTTIKKFGRPIGKYDPKKIITQDVIDKMPENSPGAKGRVRRIPSRIDKK
jgi:hypothetical protein